MNSDIMNSLFVQRRYSENIAFYDTPHVEEILLICDKHYKHLHLTIDEVVTEIRTGYYDVFLRNSDVLDFLE